MLCSIQSNFLLNLGLLHFRLFSLYEILLCDNNGGLRSIFFAVRQFFLFISMLFLVPLLKMSDIFWLIVGQFV